MSDDEIMAAMRPHLDEGDGGYICDMARKRVIAAGRAIEQASRRAALEEAAKVCNTKGDEYHAAYKRAPVDDPRRGNPYVEGMSDGCSNCADAIRALTDGDKR